MSLHRSSRKLHKWLMLLVGLQFLVWSITGTYMVLMDIDYIHGDTLVTQETKTIEVEQVNYSFKDLLTEFPTAKKIELGLLVKQGVYRFTVNKIEHIVSATNGHQLSPVDKETAIDIAKRHYKHKSVALNNVELINQNPPRELSSRYLPVWRIDFEDFASPSFYISVNSGQLVTKRHSFWRIFDWMFAFHVMDYLDEEPDNKLLMIVSILAILASTFGLVLTYMRVGAPIRKRSNRLVKSEVTNEKNL